MKNNSGNTLLRRLAQLLPVLVLIDAIITAYAALRAPFPLVVPLGSPTAYLNIYIHVPMAWSSYMLFTGALIFAIMYLVKGKESFDKLVYGFALVGVVYAFVTTFSGSVWAAESWGSPWNWDPRETGIVLLLLAYIVYFAIRSSIADPDAASRLSSVYAIAAYATVPLSFLAPSLIGGLHPTPRATAGFFSHPNVLALFILKIFLASIIAVTIAVLYAYRKDIAVLVKHSIYRVVGVTVIIIGILVASIIFMPQVHGVERVIDANVSDGLLLSVTLASNKTIVFPEPIRSPIAPPAVSVDGKVIPTIIGHIVTVTNRSITVVIHWSVAANAILYLAMLGLLLIALQSPRRH